MSPVEAVLCAVAREGGKEGWERRLRSASQRYSGACPDRRQEQGKCGAGDVGDGAGEVVEALVLGEDGRDGYCCLNAVGEADGGDEGAQEGIFEVGGGEEGGEECHGGLVLMMSKGGYGKGAE